METAVIQPDDPGPKNQPKRPPGFPKGKSGNPNGRPKAYDEFVKEARKHTPRALEVLIQYLEHPNPNYSMRAAELLLERAWGRAPQEIKLQMDGEILHKHLVDRPPDETREQWVERKRRELAELQAIEVLPKTPDK